MFLLCAGTYSQKKHNCSDAFIIFNDALGDRDYLRAYSVWHTLLDGDCDVKVQDKPTIISNGAIVIKHLIGLANEEKKPILIDSLVFNYKKGIELLGGKPKLTEGLGIVFAKYKEDSKGAYGLLNESIDSLGIWSKTSSIQYYFIAVQKLGQQNKLTKQEMAEQYLRLKELCQKVSQTQELSSAKKANWDQICSWLSTVGDKWLNGKSILNIYGPQIDSNPQNLELLKRTLDLLDKQNVKLSEDEELVNFYLKVLEYYISIAPTANADSYFQLSRLEFTKGKKDQAKESLNKAYKLSGQNEEVKHDIVVFGATYLSDKWYPKWEKDFPNDGLPILHRAKEMAEQVKNKAIDPNLTIRRLAYCKAIEICEKAKSKDPSVVSYANELINSFSLQIPSCGDIFHLPISRGEVVKLPVIGAVTVCCQ
jgi:tetratricopeptide (TPR) repeat protein